MVNNLIIPSHNYTERELSVINILKNNSNINIKSLLNVGFHTWNNGNHWWIKICEENNIDWEILEIFEYNVNDTISKGCPQEKIQLGNILDVNEYSNVDCLLFWHGPEHIEKNTFLNKLPEIEKKANKLIIFGMPLGHEEQGAAYGNPYEIHVSDWLSIDWKNLGYNVIEVHDRIPAHITVFKVINSL
jgi:hypothetical protein